MKNRIIALLIAIACTGCSGGSLKVSPTNWLEIQMGEFDGLKYERTKDKTFTTTTLDTKRLEDK